MRRTIAVSLALGVLLLLNSSALAGVAPPHSTVGGKTMAQWSQDWWKWAWSFPEILPNDPVNPVYENPLYDNNGTLSGLGNLPDAFFIGGVYRLVTDPASPGKIIRTRTATVPLGKRIFFPVGNAASSSGNPDRPQTDEGLINLVTGNINLISEKHASIDGVPVANLDDYREPSGIFDATFGENNIYGVPPTRQGIPWHSNSDGYWLMVEGLAPGQHTLNFGTTFGPVTAPVLAFDITYDVTVTPEPGAMLFLVGSALALLRRRS